MITRIFQIKLFIYLILVSSVLGTASASNNTLNRLLQDFSRYSTSNTGFHEGNVRQHSIWVSKFISTWFTKGNSFTKELNAERDSNLAILTGLLHDVGKCGDGKTTFTTKPNHPSVGREYILGGKKYATENSNIDFNILFTELNINDSDKRTIAALVAAHHTLGECLNGGSSAEDYLNKLKNCAQQAGLKEDAVDERFIRLATLISAADVKGSRHYSDNESKLEVCKHQIDVPSDRVREVKVDHFNTYEYGTKGIELRDKAIEIMKNPSLLKKESFLSNHRGIIIAGIIILIECLIMYYACNDDQTSDDTSIFSLFKKHNLLSLGFLALTELYVGYRHDCSHIRYG